MDIICFKKCTKKSKHQLLKRLKNRFHAKRLNDLFLFFISVAIHRILFQANRIPSEANKYSDQLPIVILWSCCFFPSHSCIQSRLDGRKTNKNIQKNETHAWCVTLISVWNTIKHCIPEGEKSKKTKNIYQTIIKVFISLYRLKWRINSFVRTKILIFCVTCIISLNH